MSLGILLLLAAAGSPAGPAYERVIDVAGPGVVALRLDQSVYESARSDLGDLRVLDAAGREIPYLLQRASVAASPVPERPTILNRTFRRGESASATLDFGRPLRKREIRLSLSGDNFRRSVVVEGSPDGRRFQTLVDPAYVFAVPAPTEARYETVALPENDFRYLRVTVHSGPDDPERITIRDAWVPRDPGPRVEEAPLTPGISLAQDRKAGETRLVLDLGARHQPFTGLVLDVADARFFRGAVVEARRVGPPAAGRAVGPVRWRRIGEGVVYRHPAADGAAEATRLRVSGRERVLRVRILDGDDRPLEIRGVTVMTPVERLAFEALSGGQYRLRYGTPGLTAPRFDLGRTLPDREVWLASAYPGRLGAPVPLPMPPEKPAPWTERHPAVLWIGLLAVVLLLGGVTWGALRRAG